jgi:hypothetical protein
MKKLLAKKEVSSEKRDERKLREKEEVMKNCRRHTTQEAPP